MTITAIYTHYQIPENLQQHQLRVAGVAHSIAHQADTNLTSQEREHIVLAALLHDMGNIIKFNFSTFPELLPEETHHHWRQIKAAFIDRYGADEHDATHRIVEELAVADTVKDLITSTSFADHREIQATTDPARQIVAYADMRVTPFGVSSLEERLADLRNRYQHLYPSPEHEAERKAYEQSYRDIEDQLAARAGEGIRTITEADIADIIEDLKSVEVDADPDQLPTFLPTHE